MSVLLNRPAHNIAVMLHKQGIDLNKLTFADHVSKVIRSEIEQINTVYATGKFSFQRMDALLTALVDKTNQEQKLMIFDALHDLYAYYSDKIIIKFMDQLLDRARILKLNPVFVFDRKKISKRLMRRLGEVCDQVVKL